MFFVVCVVLLAIGLLAFLALWVLDSFSLLYPSLSSSPATSSWRQMTNTEGTNQEQEISLESVKSCDSGLPSYEEAIERCWDSREKKEKKIEANKRQLNDKMDWNSEQASDIGKQGNLVQVKISTLIQICISLVFFSYAMIWKPTYAFFTWNIFILQTRKKLYNLTGGSCCGWVLESIPKWGKIECYDLSRNLFAIGKSVTVPLSCL